MNTPSTLPVRPVPAWLLQVTPDSTFPRREVLDGCLYYPASNTDGDPVSQLAGYIHSFVYTDYAVGRRKVTNELVAPLRRFRGYTPLFTRDLSARDLAPEDHVPMPPPRGERDPNLYADVFKEPFATWSVLQRDADMDDAHGPERFSFVFIGGEGVATYDHLFHGNQLRPEILAIIQPGTGFGLNWTDFFDEDRALGTCVMGNRAGTPTYLLTGMWGRGEEDHPRWRRYPRRVHAWQAPHHHLALWSREDASR